MVLKYFEPALPLLPIIQAPRRNIGMRQKTIYTAITLFIYLLCCQIPLYGVLRSEGSDPFYWMRVILASNRGTLMELGLSPIISAGWIMQLLVGTKMLSVDMNDNHQRTVYGGVTKLLSLVLAFGEAIAYVASGSYGSTQQIGLFNQFFIVFQLTTAGVVVILLDQMLEKGYGLGSGISLFIAANMCQLLFWKTFSPITLKTQYGTQFEGCFISLFHFLATKPNLSTALYMAFFRTSGSNLTNIFATLLIFFLVIYLQGFKIILTLINQRVKGKQIQYPIKLFYTSNISVIFQSAFVSNFYYLSQILYTRAKTNPLVKLLGEWQTMSNGQSIPVGGFAYYISPPFSITQFLTTPLKSLIYVIFVMVTCAFFSRFWLQISKQSPKQIAQKMKDQGFTMAGSRDQSLYNTFNKYIPTAATCGGMVIGLVTILADLLGAIGSGTGILLSVTIIYGFYEKVVNDKKESQITF